MVKTFTLSLFLYFSIFFSTITLFAEGTKQVRPIQSNEGALVVGGTNYTPFATYTAPPNYRLYINIQNVSETILFGCHRSGLGPNANYQLYNPADVVVMSGTLTNTVNTPGHIDSYAQAVEGPFPSPVGTGYLPLSYQVTNATQLGNYYIAFSNLPTFPEFDITVVTGANTPALKTDTLNGRVWSQAWQFNAPTTGNFYGNFYVYSDDGIVTRLNYNNAGVGSFTMFCNSVGCTNTGILTEDRKSKNYNTYTSFPGIAQYKVFLNNPNPVLCPNGVYGTFNADPIMIPDPNFPLCSGKKMFVIDVTKSGNVDIVVHFPGNPTLVDKYLLGAVLGNPPNGVNNISWDGTDGNLVPVPDGTPLSITISYVNGLTNLPLWDIERNPQGFQVSLYRPTNPQLQVPLLYWDDSQLTPTGGGSGCPSPPTGFNFTGCLPGSIPGISGCHPWSTGDCHNKMINTWWFSASAATATVVTAHTALPPLPVALPQYRCEPGTMSLTATVLLNEVVRWWDQPTGGNLLFTGSPYVVNLPSVGDFHFYAEAYNPASLCISNPPRMDVLAQVASYPVAPSPLGGPFFVCGAGPVTLVSNNILPGIRIDWYDNSSPPVQVGSGNSYTTPGLITTTTYFAEAVNVASPAGCTSTTRTPFIAEVRPIPSVANTVTTQSICSMQAPSIPLSSVPPGSTYSWIAYSTPPFAVSGFSNPGGGNTINELLTNNTGSVAAATYMVTPTLNQCSATTATPFVITVNPFPVPAITGENSVCKGIPGKVYTSQPGMSNYLWTVSPGGTITAGGGTTENSVTVTWTVAGTESVSVNFTEISTGCTALFPTIYAVTVNPLPVPSFTAGENAVCLNIPGKVYTTDTGKLNYIWTIPPQATTTAGGTPTDNSVTLTWNTVGSYSVDVNYTEPTTLCTAASATPFPVTVNPLPVPTFTSGENAVCLNVPGKVYTTQAGKSNYIWTIPPQADVTAGGTVNDNSVTLTWNTVGSYSISVNYTEPTTLCTAASASLFPVTVKPLPVPSFNAGENSVCLNIPGKVYITETGKSNYIWTIPPQATVTAGGTVNDNNVTLTWNTVGNYSIGVNYTEPTTLCTAASASLFPVTVKPLPVPNILTGPAIACVNTPGPQYHTDPGMSGYTWTVNGGTYTYGITPDIIDVIWTSTGIQNLTINYTAANGCVAAIPTVFNVTVSILPVPTITTGPSSICTDIPTSYSTQSGMSGYIWTVTPDGSFSGGNTNIIDVTWNTTGLKQVSVNYQMGPGCTGAAPAIKSVMVNQSTPPVITSPANPICQNKGTSYSTQAGMSNYTWTVSPGGTFTTPINGNIVNVTWNGSGPQYVDVNFTNSYGCVAPVPYRYNVQVNPLPVTTITAGTGPDCQLQQHVYQTNLDPACTFTWTANPGSVASGQGTNLVTINWLSTGPANVSVTGTYVATTGCSSSSSYLTTVYPSPVPSIAACFDLVTTLNAKPILLKGGTPVGTNGHYYIDQTTGSPVTWFNPATAGPGPHTIYYGYTNNYGCIAFDSKQITVLSSNAGFSCGTLLTDPRDTKTYKTVLIAGSQCWMQENLRYSASLPYTSTSFTTPQTDNCTFERYCLSADPNCTLYGGFYQWDELMQYNDDLITTRQGFCPPGWHVPNEAEWNTLINAISQNVGSGIAGSFLKDMNTTALFKAQPAGIFYLNNLEAFSSLSLQGVFFWTSAYDPITKKAIARGLNSINPSVSRYEASKADGFPVRCVKDN